MTIEAAVYINTLDDTYPASSDAKSEGDNHIRQLKTVLQSTFAGIAGAVTPTHTELNYVDGVTSAIQGQLDLKAPLASPALTGTPTAPTPATLDSSTKIATTANVDAKIFAVAIEATLPAQTGNDGKFVTTDGTTASWGYAGQVQYTDTVYNDVNNVFMDTSAAPTLPDLTTVVPSFALSCFTNASAVPSAFTTSDGWSIASGMVAGTYRNMTASSKATAHGTWNTSTMTPPTLETITGSAANTIRSTCNLSATLSVVMFSNATSYFAVAVNPVTGAAGAVVTLGGYVAANAAGCAIFADTATTFTAIFASTTTNVIGIAGSVSTVTITLGTAANLTTNNEAPGINNTPIQLAAGLYAISVINSASDDAVAAMSVSGTTCTWGAKVAVVSTDQETAVIAPVSATTFLLAYFGTGGASNTTRTFNARVVSVAGTTCTLETAAVGATNVNDERVPIVIGTFSTGTSYFAVCRDGSASTTGNWYGVTVSGTAVTIGTVNPQANNLPATFFDPPFVCSKPKKILKYNSTTFLFGHMTTGVMAVTISGTTLTMGTPQAIPAAAASSLCTDFAGTGFYVIGSAAYDRITVSGTTFTSVESLAVVPAFVISSTVSPKSVSYSGTWYTWTLANVANFITAISATKWLQTSSNDILITGEME